MTAPTAVNAQAVMDAVRGAVTARGIPFGDSKMPTREGSKPWVVAWADSGTRSARTMTAYDWSTVLTCHCYGLTADSARIAARLLGEALLGLFGQTIAGHRMRMPTQETALPVSRDDSLNPPVFDAVVEWRLTLT